MVFWLWDKLIPNKCSVKSKYLRKRSEAYLHTGHVPLDFNQGMMHDSWNGWLHGRVTTTCSSGSSVFKENWSLQMAQSLSSNGAKSSKRMDQTSQGMLVHTLTSFFEYFSGELFRYLLSCRDRMCLGTLHNLRYDLIQSCGVTQESVKMFQISYKVYAYLPG